MLYPLPRPTGLDIIIIRRLDHSETEACSMKYNGGMESEIQSGQVRRSCDTLGPRVGDHSVFGPREFDS